MRQRSGFGGVAILMLAAALASGQSAPLTIVTTALPDGSLGVSYPPQTLSATGGYDAVTTWSIVGGKLPGGLILSTDGIISGTPNTTGSSSFTVQASQNAPAQGPPIAATQALAIFIKGTKVAITTPSLPSGTVGVPYSQTFSSLGAASGDVQSWLLSAGRLPPGLVLSQGGTLSGTPTGAGSFSFVIQLVDRSSSGGVDSALGIFTLTIAAASPITITANSSLPAGSVGIAYTQQMTATGGVPAYVWSLTSGALPDGISLNATSGVISGTPANAGTFSFQLSASDQAGANSTGAFTIVVTGALSVSTPPALPAGASGTPYTATLSATGGTAPYTWSVLPQAGSLPPGLTLDPSTGRLAGTPTASGDYQVLAGVTDAAGRTASKLLTLKIAGRLAIVTPSPLPNGAAGSAYQAQLMATGGTPAYTWSIAAGALPAGLALDSATGMLAGTPSAGGAFDLTIGVKDAMQSANKPYRLTISVPALPAVSITGLPDSPSPATQPTLGISLGAAYTLNLTGHAALTFVPDSASDDPAVQFTTGGRSADFQVPAGSAQAVFGSSSLGVQTGTVAGTITVTLRVFAAGVDLTPTPAPTKVLRIAAAPPVVTSAKLVATSTGFDLLVIGYATTREITGTTVHLTSAAGTKLATSDFTIPLSAVFTAWYQDAASMQFGSQFSLRIPFAVQNVTNAVSSLTVTLTNAQGTSTAVNATF
jgi:hypothetical protein